MARSRSVAGRSPVIVAVFFTALAVALYWPWFRPGFISYGDWWHNLPSRVAEYRHFLIWDGAGGLGAPLGLGFGNSINIYWVPWLYGLLQETFGIATSISVRLVWFIPCILFSFYSAWFLGYTVSKRQLAAVVTAVIYSLSTFALLGLQGGHMLIILAYYVAPLALGLMIRLLRDRSSKTAVWLALVLSLQAIYDVRITYITLLAIGLYLVYYVLFDPDRAQGVARKIKLLGLTILTGVLVSAYWLSQLFFPSGAGQGLVPKGYDGISWLKTLSYANLTNALATSHVWWPWSEGVKQPIQPLFLLSLILAVLALMLWKKYRSAIFFVFLFLVGAFLTKGINTPVGGVYSWLFQHFPGFSFFRDPAKFFSLVMLGVAPAAGLGAVYIVDRLQSPWKRLVTVVIIFLLLLPNFGILFGQRHGTFITKTMPPEYTRLAQWLGEQPEWGRMLWLPTLQRYIPGSQAHPVLGYQAMGQADWLPFVRPDIAVAGLLAHPYGEWLLQHTGVRYLGVPYDSENEIFPYFAPPEKWQQAITNLSVRPVPNLPSKISLYELAEVKPEVYLANQAVLADASILPTSTDLPALKDEVLVLREADAGSFTVPDLREQLVALQPQTAAGIWQFNLNQNLTGTVRLDPALSNRALQLDDQPFTTAVSLTTGVHTLKLTDEDADHRAVLQPAASQNWQGCATDQSKPDTGFTAGGAAGAVIQPLSTSLPTCARLNLGRLSRGLYRVVFEGYAEAGVVGKLSFTSETGVVKEVVIPATKMVQTFGISVTSKSPVGVQFFATQKTAAVTGKARIISIGVQKVLDATPTQLRVQVAPEQKTAPAPVHFAKISPREYQLSLPDRTAPQYLVLNQAFKTNWRLVGINATDHRVVNGGLNAWYIPAGAAVSVQIIYGAYWTYWIGIVITLLTLLCIGIWLIRNKSNNV